MPHILAVGRDPELLETRSYILRSAGYTVDSVTTTDQASRLLQNGNFDLVLFVSFNCRSGQGMDLCVNSGFKFKNSRRLHSAPLLPKSGLARGYDDRWGTRKASAQHRGCPRQCADTSYPIRRSRSTSAKKCALLLQILEKTQKAQRKPESCSPPFKACGVAAQSTGSPADLLIDLDCPARAFFLARTRRRHPPHRRWLHQAQRVDVHNQVAARHTGRRRVLEAFRAALHSEPCATRLLESGGID